MADRNITTVIFDYGGVVGPRSDDWANTHRNISIKTGLSLDQLSQLSLEYWPLVETGKKSVHDFWRRVIGLSGKDLTEEGLEKMYETNFVATEGILELITDVKNLGYHTVMVSNASKTWMEFKIKKFRLNEYFEKIYNSADIGMTKPAPEVFEYIIKDLGVDPGQVVFVDDRIENIEGAKNFGIGTILFKDSKQTREELGEVLNINL